ncbi:MAG: DnaJ domain-containing protein [Candidatus Micrarchaeaceae archaeon]
MQLGALISGMRRKAVDSKESKLYKDIEDEKRAFKSFTRKFLLEYDSEYMHYFSALGIKPTKDKVAIREAYRTMIKAYHPDVNKSLLSEEITKEANEAYRFLSNYNMHSEDESLPKRSRSLLVDGLSSEYERLLERDYDKLKRSLDGGSVEVWYYEQETGRFLDWNKRCVLAVNNVLGDFMLLGKRFGASIKIGKKLLKQEREESKRKVLYSAVAESEYLYDRYVRIKKLIDKDVLKDFYAAAKKNSDDVRKRWNKRG